MPDDVSSTINLIQTGYAVKPALQNSQALSTQAGTGATQTATQATGGSKILIIGDSLGQFAGGSPPGETDPYKKSPIPQNTLQEGCGGSTVTNLAVGATNAKTYWLVNNGSAIKAAVGSSTGWTHVWLAVGGNDLGQIHGCGIVKTAATKADIKSDLTEIITIIKSLTNAQIVFTGYPVTAADNDCTLPQQRDIVAKAMTEIAVDPKVTWASLAGAADGIIDATARAAKNCSDELLPVNTWQTDPAKDANMVGVPPCRGKRELFADLIHLNAQGYAKGWARPHMQLAFGCGPKNSTNSTPPPNCLNNDASIVAAAASVNMTITGCVDVPPGYCTHPMYGETVRRDCKTLCNAACR
jgi:lysophospholipase L1-like esterase